MSKYNYRLIHRNRLLLAAAGAFATVGITGTLLAAQFGDWIEPVNAENPATDPKLNTVFNDGCPILSPDGLSLYMATNRPVRGAGGLDIWVATRATTTSAWGAPAPLPREINTADDEFCPTPIRGRGLFFVRRPAGGMNGDIYRTRLDRDGWREPERLPDTINSTAQEWSPAYFEDEAGNEVLYFSTTRNGPQKIYASVNYGQARPVAELNAGGDAARPNVRKDGREIVFDSTRSPNLSPPGVTAAPDIWTATRGSTAEPWSAPRHLPKVSSPATDTRASLSWDGTFLLVGSNRAESEVTAPGAPAQADIYVSTRTGRNGE